MCYEFLKWNEMKKIKDCVQMSIISSSSRIAPVANIVKFPLKQKFSADQLNMIVSIQYKAVVTNFLWNHCKSSLPSQWYHVDCRPILPSIRRSLDRLTQACGAVRTQSQIDLRYCRLIIANWLLSCRCNIGFDISSQCTSSSTDATCWLAVGRWRHDTAVPLCWALLCARVTSLCLVPSRIVCSRLVSTQITGGEQEELKWKISWNDLEVTYTLLLLLV